jgi:hypothetical protein
MHGLDINDPEFGRWVVGNVRKDQMPGWEFHQNWSHAFNQRWKEFMEAEPPNIPHTRERIIQEMNTIRAEFPSLGRSAP